MQRLLIPTPETEVPPKGYVNLEPLHPQLPGRLVDLAVGPEAAEVLKLSGLTVKGCSVMMCTPPQVEGMPPHHAGMGLAPFALPGGPAFPLLELYKATGPSVAFRDLFRSEVFGPNDLIELSVMNPSDHPVIWDGVLIAECVDPERVLCSKCGMIV